MRWANLSEASVINCAYAKTASSEKITKNAHRSAPGQPDGINGSRLAQSLSYYATKTDKKILVKNLFPTKIFG